MGFSRNNLSELNRDPTPIGLMGDTIAGVVEWQAARNPERPAIVGSNFIPFSYRELNLHIKQISDQLNKARIGPSSRVGIVLPQGPEAVLFSISIASNAVSVPLNPNLSSREFEEELNRFRLDALVLPSWIELPEWAVAQKGSLNLFTVSKAGRLLSSVTLEQICGVSSPPYKASALSPQSVALLLKTSGTTGAGKLVPVTHENLLALADKMQRWFDLTIDDRCASILPAHSAQGFKVAILAPLLLGGSVAIPATPNNDIDWISDLRPSWFWSSPTFLQNILDSFHAGTAHELDSLRFILCGASVLPAKLRAEAEATLNVPILEVYGSSEAGVMSANPAPPRKRKPGTVGVFNPDEVAIKDNSTGMLLPTGVIGEIVVRGPSVTPGYIENENLIDANAESEWLGTGDLGFVDAEGFLTIVGRIKELINRGGEKISPYDIEKVLHSHRSVQEAAAFAVPHPRLGENVAAAVVLKSAADITAAELKTFLRTQLTPSKVPQHIFITSALPRGATGKISRSELSAAASKHVEPFTPPKEPLELQIAAIWQKVLKRTDFGIDDDFFKAGGDSLQAMQVLLEIETLTGQRIPDAEFSSALTIRELVHVLVRGSSTSNELVTCVRNGSLTPYFFCHGGHGIGLYAHKLASLLADNQPVYVLRPYRSSEVASQVSIEEMAQSYLPQLLKIQPNGRFQLGGFCNGGLLALGLTEKLEQAGREVDFVVLCECISFNVRSFFRAYARTLKFIARISPRSIRNKIRLDGMSNIWHAMDTEFGQRGRTVWTVFYVVRGAIKTIYRAVKPVVNSQEVNSNPSDDFTYHRAMANYFPSKVKSAVFCILCEESRHKAKYSTSAWKSLAPEVHVAHVAGEHLTCITTHINEIADITNKLLQRSQASSCERSESGRLALH